MGHVGQSQLFTKCTGSARVFRDLLLIFFNMALLQLQTHKNLLAYSKIFSYLFLPLTQHEQLSHNFSCNLKSPRPTLFLRSSSIRCTLVHKSHAIVASCSVSLVLSSEGWWQVIAESTDMSNFSLEVWSNTIMSDHS